MVKRSIKKILILFIISGLFWLPLTACSIGEGRPYEADTYAMGTIVSQSVYGKNSRKAADEVFGKISYLDGLLTIDKPGGDINKLNAAAGKSFVDLGPEAMTLLNVSLEISSLSGGAFDPTIGPVVKAWGISTDNPRIPPDSELEKLLKLVDYKDIVIDGKNSRAMLKKQGQIVDLGGIAKGYAADCAINIYKKYGISSAFVNLGGNVSVLGKKPDGTPWNIGIQNPRAENGKIVGIVKISDESVVTSGDYERYFIKDGKRYHHIFDPETGRPAESGLMSVTIVAASSTEADALSTAVFVLGPVKGLELIRRYGKAEAIFITSDKKIFVTPGLKDSFRFKDESGQFEYDENIEDMQKIENK